MIRRFIRPLLLGAALAPLCACITVGPDYQLPRESALARGQQQPLTFDARGATVDQAQSAALDHWWQLYEDPVLNTLIEQALTANTELRIAAARLSQAQARYQQTRGMGGWHAGVRLSDGRGRISGEGLALPEALPIDNLEDNTLQVAYEVDLFGKIRRATEAAQAGTEAVQAAGDLARISVAAGVAGAYVEICHSNHEIAVARQSLTVQEKSRDVAARLEAAGRGTPTAVERAQAQVSTLAAAIPPLTARRQAAGYELAELLGRTPDAVPAEALACEEAPSLAQAIPVGDGAALLRRRPDVRHAERELAASTAVIGVVTADLYPEVRLGGMYGSYGLLKDIGRLAAQEWAVGPLITWSVPGREAHARVAVAKAGADVALAELDRTVLQALRETQTILSTYAEDLRREAALRDARDHARTAAEDLRRLYQAGREPYLSSLDAERTLASTEAGLANAQAQVSQDQIHLFKALGGGWRRNQMTPVAQTAPAADPHE